MDVFFSRTKYLGIFLHRHLFDKQINFLKTINKFGLLGKGIESSK